MDQKPVTHPEAPIAALASHAMLVPWGLFPGALVWWKRWKESSSPSGHEIIRRRRSDRVPGLHPDGLCPLEGLLARRADGQGGVCCDMMVQPLVVQTLH
jgi:hypothetical protein